MTTPTPAGGGPGLEVVDPAALLLPRVVLRPLDRGDTATVTRVFDGLSERSRRLRFLAPTPRLDAEVLALLTDVDHDRHGCWVAVVDGEPVGVGRYVRLGDEPDVAEVALEVVDAYQGHGLGRLLRGVVAVAAADVGITRLLWVLDPANTAIRRLAVPLGGRFALEAGALEGRTPMPVVDPLLAARVRRAARCARDGATLQGAA
ncbi:GNAT family N-acetyltransferase [Geodermatophilus sp. YIM 151500]|uniref:GNAT family N-acetyltransferase n=1 Tax=Geodermatophilus sp. YIM 151500 TaxID=2984531 RepID=UPI0021E3B195|nr:GNAT family N-acetyltransferase [Geodermatophilus sp. YIM 151500]MCV2491286.1 GNAT family N-acetyltransferase [Geodermatophilus sp. YIM 151500]